MKTTMRIAAAAVFAAAASTAMVAIPAQAATKDAAKPAPAPKLSKAVGPLLGEAQKLSAAGDLPGALAKTDAALALPDLTPTQFQQVLGTELGVVAR